MIFHQTICHMCSSKNVVAIIPQRAQLKLRDVSANTGFQGTEMNRRAVLRVEHSNLRSPVEAAVPAMGLTK